MRKSTHTSAFFKVVQRGLQAGDLKSEATDSEGVTDELLRDGGQTLNDA